MKRFSVLFSVVALALYFSGVPANADGSGPSTPEERSMVRELTAQLEAQPLGKSAKKARTWMMAWLTEVPDISVSVCDGIVGPLIGQKKNYATELLMQTMFSAAAFAIDHPGQAGNEFAKQLAGVHGMLRAYEAILKQKPNVHLAFLDDLLVERKRGKLEAWVQEQTDNCKQSK